MTGSEQFVRLLSGRNDADELNQMDHETKNDVIYQMQDRPERLEQNYENLVEREEDLKDFPQEVSPHDIPEQELNEAFGEGNWKSMPDEIFWQLRFDPAKWTAEKHIIKVYVGTEGAHQDEFLRGDHPKAYYKDFDGILMTDGLEQYHKLERDLTGVKNANCMAHARRHFANVIKAIGKSNPKTVESSVAYKALVRIGAIYDLERALKERTPEERLRERQASIKPLVEEFG